MQNGVHTLKITNIDFKNNEEYKLSLKISSSDTYYYSHQRNDMRFGLVRIAECSNNYGKYIICKY